MRSEVYDDVNGLYLSNDELHKKYHAVDKQYPRARLDQTLCFGNHESEHMTANRIGRFVEETYRKHGGQSTVVFVSHGGPTGVCFEHLMRLGEGNAPLTGYTGTYVYRPVSTAGKKGSEEEGAKDWECLVKSDVSHLGAVTSAELGFATTGRVGA
jgi:broad specificity phosphatase PhoE